mmetsp:Transcript_79607/g.200227  ORF Transcript_79607/g.200227 Transcript_79607/m.200227 type:complete len:141 (-) Transcript_79607:1358-1780(-)
MIVLPICRNFPYILFSSSKSRAEVASSKSTRLGDWAKARAKATRCCSPGDSCSTQSPPQSGTLVMSFMEMFPPSCRPLTRNTTVERSASRMASRARPQSSGGVCSEAAPSIVVPSKFGYKTCCNKEACGAISGVWGMNMT